MVGGDSGRSGLGIRKSRISKLWNFRDPFRCRPERSEGPAFSMLAHMSLPAANAADAHARRSDAGCGLPQRRCIDATARRRGIVSLSPGSKAGPSLRSGRHREVRPSWQSAHAAKTEIRTLRPPASRLSIPEPRIPNLESRFPALKAPQTPPRAAVARWRSAAGRSAQSGRDSPPRRTGRCPGPRT